MSNLVSQILQAEAFQRALSQLRGLEQALDQHLKSDYEAVKADLEARVAHFKAEVARLESVIGTEVSKLLRLGNGAQQAVQQVVAEKAAAAKDESASG